MFPNGSSQHAPQGWYPKAEKVITLNTAFAQFDPVCWRGKQAEPIPLAPYAERSSSSSQSLESTSSSDVSRGSAVALVR
jgi:hypothetical protein